MQLSIQTVVTGRNTQAFVVIVDGQQHGCGTTRANALKIMDALWEKRPESDKEMERQYTGR